MLVEEKLTKIGLKLPYPPAPEGAYLGAKQSGKIAFTCGQNPFITTKRGLIGKDLSLEEGYKAAQETCLNCLAQLKNLIGSLERIKQVLQVVGFINSADGFMDQPKIMNGFTDLLVSLYGEKNGKPTCAVIPINHTGLEAIEAWMIVELK
jgi:enamine deaminase RidA (YjgF/YER057c/UK114 family)